LEITFLEITMSKYRKNLPQLKDALFMTDSGLETELIFHDGLDLPYFASFDLLKSEAGTERLRAYYLRYAEMARAHNTGLVLESPTWRASADWGARLGYDAQALANANRKAIKLMLEIRAAKETLETRMVISGNIGPRGDGYSPDKRMSTAQAQQYHATQIETFADTDADMVAAFTINYVEEAIGITHAAKACAMPVAISFTLETDGRLPSGETLEQAIMRTDNETDAAPVYYMINCAHPTHFDKVLQGAGSWQERIRGLRANASKRSHAELDNSTDLDIGDPQELGAHYQVLHELLPRLSVLGGCCGTDKRHIEAIFAHCKQHAHPGGW
jgi:homocysteine S-methyltransferase